MRSSEDDDSEEEEDENKGPVSSGRWTDEEHTKFLEALAIHGKNWNKVHKYVGTRSSAQTRSHA
jgi:SHAQKYF class myb-like DNA-binding protein